MPFAYSDPKLVKTGTCFDNEVAPSPGPGAYNTNQSTLRKKGAHIGAKTKELSVAITPGPADYVQNESPNTSSAPSMRMQPPRKTFFDNVPNPTGAIAQYPFNTSTLRRRSKSISGRNEEPVSATTPGPAEYAPDSSNVLRRAPEFSISVTERSLFEPSKDECGAPGPADFSYQERSLNRSGVGKFSKGGMMPALSKHQNPGVGAYQIATEKSGSAGFTFGSRRAVGGHF